MTEMYRLAPERVSLNRIHELQALLAKQPLSDNTTFEEESNLPTIQVQATFSEICTWLKDALVGLLDDDF